MNHPAKLYKYQPYTVWSLDNLKNRQLWFSKPCRLNDPFDCAFPTVPSEPNEDEWRRLHQDARETVQDKERFDLEYSLNGNYSDQFRNFVRRQTKDFLTTRRRTTLYESGLACFSEILDNLLMWSHYADGHRGFCLEFDVRSDPFHKAIPVRYLETLPRFNPVEILAEGPSEPLMDLIRTKSINWSYEKEWRIFQKIGDLPHGIKPESLTAIYFGCAMPDVHRQIISALLAGSPTRLYEMEKADGQFKVFPRAVP